MTATYHIGDVFDVMASLPDASVDLVLTSPPFLALRSYLPADHPDKAREIGSEATPAAFLDTLLALTAEWGRLLAPHGSIAVELGDTYSGSGGSGGDYLPGGMREGQARFSGTAATARSSEGRTVSLDRDRFASSDARDGWPLAKSLCIIPELYAACLAYGRNVLTGEPSPAGRWRVRNLVRWVRPNPPVGALGDKFRPATSVMVVACRARDRWFDLDAVRTPTDEPPKPSRRGATEFERDDAKARKGTVGLTHNPAGAPPLDWWEIPTEPYSGSHYATWPRKLCVRPIEAMCPRQVCRTCGEPRRRLTTTETTDRIPGNNTKGADDRQHRFAERTTTTTTLGWTDCGHDDYRPGIVLDPFAGSGTTLAVATGLGRDAIGIDIDARNADLARDRVGMFLTVRTGKAGVG